MSSRAPRPGERGAVLLWALLVSMVIATSSFVFATMSRSASNLSELQRHKAEATNLSDAATEHALAELARAYRLGTPPPTEGEVLVDGAAASFRIEPDGVEERIDDERGLAVFQSVFRVTGTAVSGRSREETRVVALARRIPLFQFAMFFENDMDFLRVAPMTIKGRVHCNAKILAQTQSPLVFDTNYVGAVGGYFGSTLVPGGSFDTGPGTVSPEVRKWVADPWDDSMPVQYFELTCESALRGLGVPILAGHGFDSLFAGHDRNRDGDFDDNGDWLPFAPRVIQGTSAPAVYSGPGSGHTLHTGAMGLNELTVPSNDALDMFAEDAEGSWKWDPRSKTYVEVAAGEGTHSKGLYHQKAELTILTQPDGSWKAYDGWGVDVSAKLAATVKPSQMYDARQSGNSKKKIQLTQINVQALNDSGLFPKNGLLYVAGYGAGTGAKALGFELFKGAELRGPLTVVSPNSVYVRGDYNTKGGIKSAAVMADAVNLLSNAWDNSKKHGALPSASDTTYNFAVVTGDVDDVATRQFQGGPHNALRRHENWTGRNEYFLGSLVCLFRSRYANADYGLNGDFYTPPTRAWTYDKRFNKTENLPPFTPQSIEIEPLVTW